MANVTVTAVQQNITVDESTSQITVSPVETTILVSESNIVSNADIRAAFTGVDPIQLDQETGFISIDDAALFSGKTTDDLAEGETNLYFTTSRARQSITSTDLAIQYNSVSGEIYLDENHIKETVSNVGAVSGNVTLTRGAASIFQMTLTGNVTNFYLEGIQAGQSQTLIVTQDPLGSHGITRSSFPSNWNWVNLDSDISTEPGATSMIGVVYDGVDYWASVVRFADVTPLDLSLNTTTDLAEGTNLYYTQARFDTDFAAKTTTDLTEGDNLYFTQTRARDSLQAGYGINYDAVTGTIATAGSYIDVIQVGDGLTGGGGEGTVDIGIDPGTGITVDANGINVDLTPFSTDNLSEGSTNLYLNGAGTTDNLTEGLTNQYFTTDRANSALVTYLGSNDISIGGNLEVAGNVNYINVEDVLVKDNKIVLNYEAPVQLDAFITVDRSGGTGGNASIKWNEFLDKWEFTDGAVTYPLARTTTDLTEGDNLYYTQARFDTAFSNKTTTDLTEGDNLYYTDARANSAIDNRVTDTFVEALGVDAAFIDFDPNGLFPADIATVQAAIDDLQLHKLNVSALTSSVSFFPTTAASDIVGYSKQVVSTADPDFNTTAVDVGTGAITATDQLIASLAGEPGELEGNTTPINITTIGNIRKTAGGTSQNARFYFEVYKRDAGGSETLIGTSNETSEISSAIYEQFSATALIVDTEFTATDRVVTKYYADNLGGGAPEYDFQFGGTEPIRTLFPVPVSVVPVNHSASEVTVDTTQFNGLLSAADDTAQKALDTLDDITLNDITGNAISGVNSITTETGSNFTLNTDDSGMVVTQPFKSETVTTGVVQGDGYAVFTQGIQAQFPIVYTGVDSIDEYTITGNITQDSNVIDITSVFNVTANVSASISDIQPGMMLLGGDFLAFPAYTYVVAVDAGNNTVTVNNTSSTTTGVSSGFIVQALVDTSTGLVIQLFSPDGVNVAGYGVKTGVYGYPRTGPTAADFDLISAGTDSDYTLPDFTPMTVAKTTVTPVKGVINSPLGLTVGENTDLTNRGELDVFTSFGVNIMWDGTQDVFNGENATVAPQMLFKSYTDGSLQSNRLSNGGPRLFFSSAYGNANNNEFDTYPRAGQELGRLAFWGTSGDFTGDSSVRPPAYFSVQAGNDWTSRNNKQTDVFLGANPGAFHDQTDLFLSYQAGRLRLAGSDATSPIQFQPAKRTAQNAPQSTYGDADAVWATVNYANVNAQSGADFTVTNGGSVGAGTVGDMQVSLHRVDNSGAQSVVSDGLAIASGSFGIYPADSVRFSTLLPSFQDGLAVTLSGFTGDFGTAVNGNTYYAELTSTFQGAWYALFLDAGLTTPLDTGVIGINTDVGAGSFAYTGVSGVTDKQYTFKLEEQSNDLQILVDGALHSTIKANGEIHDATGSKYITEADFSTLLAAQLPDQLRANQALIQELATGPVTPDYDGGAASTTTFDYSVDGGSASTTSFTDAVEGGNAAGDSIVSGGSSSTTVYASTTDGGDATTTTFDQTIDGGAS